MLLVLLLIGALYVYFLVIKKIEKTKVPVKGLPNQTTVVQQILGNATYA
jgi:hypothetical protein